MVGACTCPRYPHDGPCYGTPPDYCLVSPEYSAWEEGFNAGMVVGAAIIAWAETLQLRHYCNCEEAWTYCRVHDPDLRESEAQKEVLRLEGNVRELHTWRLRRSRSRARNRRRRSAASRKRSHTGRVG